MERIFSLVPFAPTDSLPNLQIGGKVDRNNNSLAIAYELSGNWQSVAIAPQTQIPTRKDELWQKTCFEFFLAIKNSPQYWEFNLSPAGNWNVYRFENYRQGMVEESSFDTLPFTIEGESQGLIVSLAIDLDKIIAADRSLEMAIATVIEEENGNISYWALTHPGKEADFHRRDSFTIEL